MLHFTRFTLNRKWTSTLTFGIDCTSPGDRWRRKNNFLALDMPLGYQFTNATEYFFSHFNHTKSHVWEGERERERVLWARTHIKFYTGTAKATAFSDSNCVLILFNFLLPSTYTNRNEWSVNDGLLLPYAFLFAFIDCTARRYFLMCPTP